MDFISEVKKKAQESIGMSESDYIEGGLLCCGKCHTPKEHIIYIKGNPVTVPCLCQCGMEKRDLEIEQRMLDAKARYIDRLRDKGFPDAEMSRWTFENDDWSNEKLSTTARRYVDNWQEMKSRGKGLLLYGSVGTGKTFISACIANALIQMGIPCLVTNFSRLVNQLAGSQDRQSYIDDLSKFDLIVIDDLASERDTEYMGELVQSIIDARYRSGLPMIVTTNLTADELKNPADMRRQRIFSRLFEMCIPVEVKGVDRRKQRLVNDYKDLEALLGL